VIVDDEIDNFVRCSSHVASQADNNSSGRYTAAIFAAEDYLQSSDASCFLDYG
jgi:hypothetical protein